jgi:hypothetical protein
MTTFAVEQGQKELRKVCCPYRHNQTSVFINDYTDDDDDDDDDDDVFLYHKLYNLKHTNATK